MPPNERPSFTRISAFRFVFCATSRSRVRSYESYVTVNCWSFCAIINGCSPRQSKRSARTDRVFKGERKMTNIHRLCSEAENLQRKLRTMLIISHRESGDSVWMKRINKVLDKADTRVARRYKALFLDIINRANKGIKDASREMIAPHAERQI